MEFGWERAPDPVWLKTLADLMKRSGRESVTADADGITVLFHPQDAEDALDDFDALLADAERQYRQELEQRDLAVRHVQDTLATRYGAWPRPTTSGTGTRPATSGRGRTATATGLMASFRAR